MKTEYCRVILAVIVCIIATGCQSSKPGRRYGSVIGISKESIPEYKRLHAATWPGVLKLIKQVHIRNYSIFLAQVTPDQYYLFSYFEYTGSDFAADMAKMAADETTREWWKRTDPLQVPLSTRQPGEWWASTEEVFHTD